MANIGIKIAVSITSIVGVGVLRVTKIIYIMRHNFFGK